METHLLRIFISVARYNSFSQAAVELNCAQSNVTSRIKQLEKNLGYQLFHRVSKSVKLTFEGEKLYPHALEIISKIDEAIYQMDNMTKQKVLKVGSTQVNAPIRLIPFIKNLKEALPKQKIELYTNTSELVKEAILKYDIDLGFVCGQNNHKDLHTLKEYKEELYIIESKEDESANCVFAYIESCIYYIYLATLLRNNGNHDFETVKIENYETILACVELGMGKAILPMNLIKQYGYENRLKLTKVNSSDTQFYTSLVCRKDNIPSISEDTMNIVI